jgi:hypothetical protein
LGEFVDGDAVEAEGVGAVGRAGGKDAGQGTAAVAAGVDLEGGPVGKMKPGKEKQVVASRDACQTRGCLGC